MSTFFDPRSRAGKRSRQLINPDSNAKAALRVFRWGEAINPSMPQFWQVTNIRMQSQCCFQGDPIGANCCGRSMSIPV
jgi:hypothetical protein